MFSYFFPISYLKGSILKYHFLKIYLFYFIYFWLHWVFVAAHGRSLAAASEGYSSLR